MFEMTVPSSRMIHDRYRKMGLSSRDKIKSMDNNRSGVLVYNYIRCAT